MMRQQLRDRIFITLIGAKLKQIRQLRDLSVEAVVEATKIDIERIERGEVNFAMSTFSILINYYNITPMEFFSDGFQDYNSKS